MSAPLWVYVLGFMVIVGLVLETARAAWPLLVAAAVLYAAYLGLRRYEHRQHDDEPSDSCMFCHNEVIRLAKREADEAARADALARREAQLAEADRLRAKYRNT